MRYFLWIRLSRALRVTEFFEKLEKDIRINYLFTRIVKLFVVELYCTHTAACIFYYIATTLPPSQEGYTWIGSLRMGDYSYAHFREIDLWTRYITSLYFAVVTMATVGKIIPLIFFLYSSNCDVQHECFVTQCHRLWRNSCCQHKGNDFCHDLCFFRHASGCVFAW